MQIVLASQSPRRRELLERMGIEDFVIRLAAHDETMDPTKPPMEEVARVSRLKAAAVAPQCAQEDVIIAADTIVVCDGLIMGKPHDTAEASQMLHRLSGKTHQVMTGLTVRCGEQVQTRTVVTALRFRPLLEAEIAAYVATGEPMDKAGAYGIQGRAAVFVESLDGDYYNVMGLPVCTLTALLRGFGVAVLSCDEVMEGE